MVNPMNKPVMPELSPEDGYKYFHHGTVAAHHAAWEAHCAQIEAEVSRLHEVCADYLTELRDVAKHKDEEIVLHFNRAAALEARLREVEGLPAKWRGENGDYPESKRDCADELTATLEQSNG